MSYQRQNRKDMTSQFLKPLSRKRKGPDDEITKNVVVLKSYQVHVKDGVVFMPNTTLDMSEIKKLGQSKKITFTKSTSSGDMQRKLEENFPFLSEASERFYCAKAVEGRSKLDFCGGRCVWSGAFINRTITGNSALYIYCEEEKVGDSGHYSSDSDLSGANSSGNCLVSEASQGHKRFRREPSSAAEGLCVVDKETFMQVESQKWGTVMNNDRSYTFGDQLDGVKINSYPNSKQAKGVRTCSTTQVTEKEASVCAVTVERQQHQCAILSTSDTEEEQIQVSDQFSTDPEESRAYTTLPPVCPYTSDITKMVSMTLPSALQPALPTGDLTEQKQMNSSTLLSQLKSLDISGKHKEFQKSPEQRLTHSDTFPAKENLSGQPSRQPRYLRTQVSAKEGSVSAVAIDNQQDTPVTEGASDDQIIELITTFESEIHRGSISQRGGVNSPALDLMDVENIKRWLENYDYEVSINPTESPLQIIELITTFESEIHRGSISQRGGVNSPALDLMDVENIKRWLENYDYEVSINPTESPLQGGAPCIFTFKPELPSDVNVKATFDNLEPNILEKTSLGYICKIPASPKMTPGVIPVLLISVSTGEILARTFVEYCGVEKEGILQTIQRITSDPNLQWILLLLYMRSNLGGKSGGCGCGRRGDGSSDGGASGGGASGGGAYGGGSSGGGASGSGAIGDGSSATGLSGCGTNQSGAYGGGATGCQNSRDASQPGSDVVYELCELLQKCSVCIWRQNLAAIQNKARTEDEEDLEDDQLSCSQQSDENYFADTEDYSSVSSESDGGLSDSENWDESISDSSLSFPWVNSRSSKSQEAIPKTELTQHFHKAVNSELDVSHEILAAITESFTSEVSIGEDKNHCLEWNTPLSESKKTEENYEKDDHNKEQNSSQECALCYEASTSHTLLASQDNTPVLCINVPALNVENEESQYQDDELFETLHTENAKPQLLESILSVTSNQQSTTRTGPVTQKVARSSLSNPLWNGTGDSKLDMASPQCSDEEIYSGHEWEESGLASWFDLCESEDAGMSEPSRCEMSSMDPNKTDGCVEKDVFDSKKDLNQEQGLFSEEGNLNTHLSSPDDSSVQSLGCELENIESQVFGNNPLFRAARNGDTDPVRLLIEIGAYVNEEGLFGDTPLVRAAENGHTDIMRLLIKNGADVNEGRWVIGDISIIEAAEKGYTNTVQLLIEKGADVNQRERECSSETPLTAAAKNGHIDIVRLLIENGADVNKGNGTSGETALAEAAKNGHADIVRLLIENGAHFKKENGCSRTTLLTVAAKNGHTDIVRLLIENGADVNKKEWCSGDTPLTAAARNGHTNIVRLLTENGARVNKENGSCGETALTAAAKNGHADIVRLLIENGAHLKKENGTSGETALTAAAKNGHADIVRFLIENGASFKKENGCSRTTLLTVAAKNGHTDIVRLLIENGADVDKKEWCSGDTPLTAAARNGHTNIVRLLAENGARVNKKNGCSGDTPLIAAARNGHTDIVRLLTEKGAGVNKENGTSGETALTAAAKNGHADIVRLLIENGAHFKKENGCSRTTLLTVAARNGHTDIVRLLIENGADVNTKEWCSGDTPLTTAVRNGHTDIVRLLTENGARVNKEKWSSGETPLTAAAKNGHTDIVRLLIEYGADVNESRRTCRFPSSLERFFESSDLYFLYNALTASAKKCRTDIVSLSREYGADVNKENGCSRTTLLTVAAKNGHTDILRLLIENGADVNEGNGSSGETPLTAAAKNGHTDIVRLLIENGADVNESRTTCTFPSSLELLFEVRGLVKRNYDSCGDTPLIAAARNGHTDIVRLLTEKGARVNKENWTSGETALTAAAKNGHADIVRLLIENGAHFKKENGCSRTTLLTVAARNGHTDIVRLLIENGADVNTKEWCFGDTHLTAAVRNGHTDIVRLLIENGADVNTKEWGSEDTPLSAAARNGHTDIVRLLTENGARVNKEKGSSGETPLTAAAKNGHADIVRLLIEYGADVNESRRTCTFPSSLERFFESSDLCFRDTPFTDFVRLLTEKGAGVNKENGSCGETPLTAAAKSGHADIVRLLIENGASFKKEKGCCRKTLLTAAAKNGHTDIVRLLIENGADLSKGYGRSWKTLLTAAAENGHTDIVRLLIENDGAHVKRGNGRSWETQLTAAAKNGHTDIVRLLIKNGAYVKNENGCTRYGEWLMKERLHSLRKKFEANARDTKLLLERDVDIQLRGKKTASLPKRPGKRLKTQTEMTSPRDIVEEAKCGKESMTDVELGLNCLHLSARCEQFKPCIMEESPGESSITRHDFKPISKRMNRLTLTAEDDAKQGHCVVVEISNTHSSGATSLIYGRKLNEEGSGVGEAFQLATKDLKGTWEDEEVNAENVQIGSVVKCVQVGDEYVFQGNTKRLRQNVDKILLDLCCVAGSHRDIGDAFFYEEISSERIHQDCASDKTLCFLSLKCSGIQNESISFVAKLGELMNLKLNCRQHFMLHPSPGALQLTGGEDSDDVLDVAVVKIGEPLLITEEDGSSKPWDQAICEGLVPKNKPQEISFDKKTDDEAEENDDDINN